MDPTRISKRLLWRALTAFPALISLVSAITLLPGVVGAAPKAGYPALPTQGGSLASYSAVGTNTVIYHNGPVFRNPDVKLIFEGTWGSSDMQTVKQYFTDVSGSPFEAILTQYSDTSGPISDTITVSGSNMDSNFFHSPIRALIPTRSSTQGSLCFPLAQTTIFIVRFKPKSTPITGVPARSFSYSPLQAIMFTLTIAIIPLVGITAVLPQTAALQTWSTR
ncbi:MAG TPA: hypothetical protein VH540_27905 [Ktedonobacterales bacterium]|jgi:hypothetical protein